MSSGQGAHSRVIRP